jgi:hypothetical protein
MSVQKDLKNGCHSISKCNPKAACHPAKRDGRELCGGRRSSQSSDFHGPSPDAGVLGRQWHEMLDSARQIIMQLPFEEVGKCVVNLTGELFKGSVEFLIRDLKEKRVRFHAGRIGGSWPTVK